MAAFSRGAAILLERGHEMAKRLTRLALGASFFAARAGALIWTMGATALPLPVTVRLEGAWQTYRPAGEFRRGTTLVDAPFEQIAAPAIDVMTFLVSETDYARCVADQACRKAPSANRPDLAQTNVNNIDAAAYARWFSGRTGVAWRLPSDAEWLRLASDRAFDEGFSADANSAERSRRWIHSYRREVQRRGAADLEAHPLGFFGLNDQGVADIAGNVWEWTESCFQSGSVSQDGSTIEIRSGYCAVRAVQGKHRGFIIDFVRDARSHGCGAGVPPDHLGFRLVRTVS